MGTVRRQDGSWGVRKGLSECDRSKLDAVHDDFCMGAGTILPKGSPRPPYRRSKVENATGKFGEGA